MPSKICSQCQKKNAIRTRLCECGHEFEVKNKKQSEQKIDLKIEDKANFESEVIDSSQEKQAAEISIYGLIYAPAGECPIKPKHIKEWENGIASEECIVEWTLALKEFGRGRFTFEAIVYWARYFWDIHSVEFKRVSNIIMNTLTVKKVVADENQDFAEI
jgi:hypothetical protein